LQGTKEEGVEWSAEVMMGIRQKRWKRFGSDMHRVVKCPRRRKEKKKGKG